MRSESAPKRFIYQTQGVCPPEIHFLLNADVVSQIRFLGGGCPGNAQLVARLLEGRCLTEVLPLLKGIPCRGDTSCPDQIHRALIAARDGRLQPSPSFRVVTRNRPLNRIGLLSNPQGNTTLIEDLAQRTLDPKGSLEALLVMGNLLGPTDLTQPPQPAATPLELFRRPDIWPVLGPRDWQIVSAADTTAPGLKPKTRNRLLALPQVVSFHLGPLTGVAFHGDYLQQLPGYSDYDPFALEMNMVCGLTDFMRDTSVFPALEAMTPQFTADIVIFGQAESWGHWEIGGKHFISLGPADDGAQLSWAILEIETDAVRFRPMASEAGPI